MRRLRQLVLASSLALLVGAGGGCSAAGPSEQAPNTRSALPPGTAGPLPEQVVTSDDPYVGLAQMLHARGVEVWFETDLVQAWLAGPEQFGEVVDRLQELATQPGVVGFKIADELGYQDGLTTVEQTSAFLDDVNVALSIAAPRAELLVDMVVLELGCLPWLGPAQSACASEAQEEYPAASAPAVTAYLRTGVIDRLDLSTGLREEETYKEWGTSRFDAQTRIWMRVSDGPWPRLTTLQARKALAAPGGYAGSPEQADEDASVFVDIPVAGGARAVDIWTWRQGYGGDTVSLLGDDLLTNPLWEELRERRDRGIDLMTHMTPSLMPEDPEAFARECDAVAGVFSAVFVAAGTG